MPYAPVNGLQLYYETHGPDGGVPLVLVPGSLSTITTAFGPVLPKLAEQRHVIAVELQGHGRTADIPDRPLTLPNFADDIAALIDHLGVAPVDIFGYSIGSGIAAQVAIRRPEIVRKLVLASIALGPSGAQPGVYDDIDLVQPEHMAGSIFEREYLRLAPRPEDWPALIEKVKELDRTYPEMTPDEFAAIAPPMLIIAGDNDIVTPEHAVALLRLRGGGGMGMPDSMPESQLAILPGTGHTDIPERPEMLISIIGPFLGSATP